MGVPNGEMDPWADTIVAHRLRYVQVSAFYDQQQDVPAARLPELPDNALGTWMAGKQRSVSGDVLACDQISLLAFSQPEFALSFNQVTPADVSLVTGIQGPALTTDELGPLWLITEIDGNLAATRFWDLLNQTF